MKTNTLLKGIMESIERENSVDTNSNIPSDPVSEEQVKSVMEELESYISIVDGIQKDIIQNEVNIANITNSPRPESVMSIDGEFIANIPEEVQPTIEPGSDIGDIIPLEIGEQNNRIYQNATGQLNYFGDDAVERLREDIGVEGGSVSLESARISPLRLYRAHTESLKEVFLKFLDKIKEMIKWLFARIKDVGHKVIMLFEKFNGTKDKLIAKFKEGKDRKKKFKEDTVLSSSTLLTMLTDYPVNLDTALELQSNVLQPYTQQFLEAYGKGETLELDGIISKARDELIKNKNKDGENFLTKIGIKGTDGFICIVRPGQILKLNVESKIWTVEKEDIDIDKDLCKKLMGQVNPDGMWEDALDYLNTLDKVEKVSKNFLEFYEKGKVGDERLLKELSRMNGDDLGKLKFIYSCFKFKSTILDCVLFTPRAIISACSEIYKSIDFPIKEWVTREQREESYGKTIEAFIQEERWEDLESLKTSLTKYPRLIQRIDEALRNRK